MFTDKDTQVHQSPSYLSELISLFRVSSSALLSLGTLKDVSVSKMHLEKRVDLWEELWPFLTDSQANDTAE